MPKKSKGKMIKIILLLIFGVSVFVFTIVSSKNNVSSINSNALNKVGFSTRESNLENSVNETTINENTVATKDILINSVPITRLINNNWDRMDANFTGYEADENGNMVFPNGYTIYCNKRFAEKIIFNENYQNEVIGHIKVGTDFKTIEKNLGEPSFKDKNYLGYKTKKVYIFFYENEICVYPNMNISNKSFEELLESYLDRSYKKERTYFLADVRNKFNDFTFEIDEENDIVTMKSIARQIIVKLDNIGNSEVEIYNGYQVSLENIQKRIRTKEIKVNEEDLVEIAEIERISGK